MMLPDGALSCQDSMLLPLQVLAWLTKVMQWTGESLEPVAQLFSTKAFDDAHSHTSIDADAQSACLRKDHTLVACAITFNTQDKSMQD